MWSGKIQITMWKQIETDAGITRSYQFKSLSYALEVQ